MSKVVKKVAKVAAPIASIAAPVAAFIPGGQGISAALGAVGAFAGGGESSGYSAPNTAVNPRTGQAYANTQQGIDAINQQTTKALGDVNSLFSRFTPQYYDDIRNTTTNSILRDVNRNYDDSYNNLQANLADRGITRSSVANMMNRKLSEGFQRQRLDAVLKGEDAAQSRMDSVLQQRKNATNLATSGLDLSGNYLNSLAASGNDYVPNPGGKFGSLLDATLESNALKRYKQSQQAKATRVALEKMSDPAYAEVTLNKYRNSPRYVTLN